MSVTEGRDAEVIPQLLVAEAQQTGTVNGVLQEGVNKLFQTTFKHPL